MATQGTGYVTEGAALTADVAAGDTVSNVAPAGEDYAFQASTNSTPFGFVTANEADSLISLVVNMRTRLNELEARLQAHGLVT